MAVKDSGFVTPFVCFYSTVGCIEGICGFTVYYNCWFILRKWPIMCHVGWLTCVSVWLSRYLQWSCGQCKPKWPTRPCWATYVVKETFCSCNVLTHLQIIGCIFTYNLVIINFRWLTKNVNNTVVNSVSPWKQQHMNPLETGWRGISLKKSVSVGSES